MKFIKKIDIFVFKAYSLLFVGTFFICLFIFMMQFMWRYVDELIGKGLTLDVLAHFFYYAGLTLIPMSLPLAILLASLITFGNLGERFELLSMKAAGIPLIRILQPIIIFNILLCIGSFYFQNVTGPEAQKKFYTLIYSMKQKSPELEIPEGIFYSEIPGYNIFVEKKGKENGMLYGVMIYSTTDGYEDAQIVLADSAELKTTADEKHLMLTMYAGERFRNMQAQGNMMARANVPYMRETFIQETDLIPFDNNFNMMDANVFSGSAQTKNLREIETGLDSLAHKSDSIGRSLFAYLQNTTYRRKVNIASQDSTKIARQTLNFDTLYSQLTVSQQQSILRNAMQKSTVATNEYEFRGLISKDIDQSTRTHWVEWHKKFTLSFACMVFFFIGAPLGAIIRKGGLGMPVVISVILFIFYYIIDNIGFKMARDGVWEAWQGMWLSSAILAPLGIFLTYKAVNDSVILNADTYLNALKNLFGKRSGRKVEMKEVIMFNPDYGQIILRLKQLAEESNAYLAAHKRWTNYFLFWKQGGRDHTAEQLAVKMDGIIEELSNSDQNLVLNKLMDYPVINGYNQINAKINGKAGLAISLFFPIGFPVYLLATYQRKLLRHDIKMVQKTSYELIDIIEKLPVSL